MRHRRLGRKLGRSPTHQKALLRSLATALFLTERDPEGLDNAAWFGGLTEATADRWQWYRSEIDVGSDYLVGVRRQVA